MHHPNNKWLIVQLNQSQFLLANKRLKVKPKNYQQAHNPNGNRQKQTIEILTTVEKL